MLRHHGLISYLLGRGLLTTDDIINGDVLLEDASRRNLNFKVITSTGRSYFLKLGLNHEKIATLTHEASIYQFLSTNLGESFQRFCINFISYDPEHAILILELLRETQSFRDYRARQALPSIVVHAELGKALALLHRGTRENLHHLNENFALPSQQPWILSIHHPNPDTLPYISNANLELIKTIQQFPAFCSELDFLREQWEEQSFIHFDIRWDNLLLCPTSSESEGEFKIIDWELSGIGDPRWDVGSVFHEYLYAWLASMPITAGLPEEQLPELATNQLEEFQPSIQSFWQAYIQGMQFDRNTAETCLSLAVQYGAARLLQAAYEQAQFSTEPTSTAVSLIQVSMNMLSRPREAAAYLLGI